MGRSPRSRARHRLVRGRRRRRHPHANDRLRDPESGRDRGPDQRRHRRVPDRAGRLPHRRHVLDLRRRHRHAVGRHPARRRRRQDAPRLLHDELLLQSERRHLLLGNERLVRRDGHATGGHQRGRLDGRLRPGRDADHALERRYPDHRRTVHLPRPGQRHRRRRELLRVRGDRRVVLPAGRQRGTRHRRRAPEPDPDRAGHGGERQHLHHHAGALLAQLADEPVPRRVVGHQARSERRARGPVGRRQQLGRPDERRHLQRHERLGPGRTPRAHVHLRARSRPAQHGRALHGRRQLLLRHGGPVRELRRRGLWRVRRPGREQRLPARRRPDGHPAEPRLGVRVQLRDQRHLRRQRGHPLGAGRVYPAQRRRGVSSTKATSVPASEATCSTAISS